MFPRPLMCLKIFRMESHLSLSTFYLVNQMNLLYCGLALFLFSYPLIECFAVIVRDLLWTIWPHSVLVHSSLQSQSLTYMTFLSLNHKPQNLATFIALVQLLPTFSLSRILSKAINGILVRHSLHQLNSKYFIPQQTVPIFLPRVT